MKDVDAIFFRFHFQHVPHLKMIQLASRQASVVVHFHAPISYLLQLIPGNKRREKKQKKKV